MYQISRGCEAEVDAIGESDWYKIISSFGDASIYQTWGYGSVRYGPNNLSHIIIKCDNKIVGAAQVGIIKISPILGGVAHIRWGPLWRRSDLEYSIDDFRRILIALRLEYVDRRGLFLRLIPNETELVQAELRPVLESVGFRWHHVDYRTLLLDLRSPLVTIRGNMSKNWRKHLNKAEKSGLDVIEGTDDCLFEKAYNLYEQLLLRKKFEPGIKIEEYRNLQNFLPEPFKMHIMVCEFERRPIACLVGSSIGEAGIELIAATGDDGLELGGSYLLRWKMLAYFKNLGCLYYNLNGINPDRNPGGYQFKSGLCAKNGLDVRFLGTFEACNNSLSYWAVGAGERLRKSYNKVKRLVPF